MFSEVLGRARDNRVFPGASVLFSRDKTLVEVNGGRTTYDSDAPRVTPDTLYDLASLTKLFTLTVFLIVARRHAVDVETPLREFLPDFGTPEKRDITLQQLMQHNSGISFPIQKLAAVPCEDWMPRVSDAPLHARPGERVLYSCTNFWLLAHISELLSGQTLDALFQDLLFVPLQLTQTTLAPRQIAPLPQIAPTEIENGVAVHGQIHDEAARFWREQTNTCCGNAGLFGTARDVFRFAQLWLHGEILHPDDIARALNDVVSEGACFRAWGWQFDNRTFAPTGAHGHTGFTGPTLWIRRDTREVGVVLNNRVHPTRNGPHRMTYHRELNKLFLDER